MRPHCFATSTCFTRTAKAPALTRLVVECATAATAQQSASSKETVTGSRPARGVRALTGENTPDPVP
jgi:hypothetical protein